MATHRRLLPLTRHLRSVLSALSSQSQFQFQTLTLVRSLHYQNPQSNPFHSLPRFRSADFLRSHHFSSRPTESDDEEDADDEEDDEDDESDYEEEEGCNGTVRKVRVSGKSEEEKVAEAAGIGYKVVGPLGSSEMPFKPWEPVFAIVQVGSHQFKVCNGDSIFCERLKFCDVNDKLILNKVLMLGSKTQTIIGRPILPDAAVHAVVEEHALDAKVIIFKKKRRKNYRRTKGHRQELTKLRITDIQGIDKSEAVAVAA